MFTGIIQGQAEVVAIKSGWQDTRFTFSCKFELPNIQLGESIAINGACLTVEASSSANQFMAYASTETLAASTLGQLRQGSLVNVERALAVGDRLGGHIVSGHVDCLATVIKIFMVGESTVIRVQFPTAHAPEVVGKGSVTLDGISLTVNSCGEDFLEVNIIPETLKNTTIQQWQTGSKVNLETDILGKYVRNMLKFPTPAKLSTNFLQENGFI